MNILFLTYQGDMAGATNSICYLAAGLAARGHRVYVGCREQSLLFSLLADTQAVAIPMTFRSKIDRQCMRHIRDIVQQYDIQIINAQSSKDRYLSILARWWYKLPVKLVHTRRQKSESVGGWLQNQFYVRGTDAIVTVSHQLKQDFISRGFPPNHLHVILNGMDTKRFVEQSNPTTIALLRSKFNLLADDVVVGCISRRKKQEQLLQALALLPSNLKVLFVGIEPHCLDETAKQLSLKNTIIYAGMVPTNEVLNYYALCSVNVLPSTMDGFGLTLIEAMGMGVPVVGTRAQGIIDVIGSNEKNGLLFDDNNIAQLADKLRIALFDNKRRQELIAAGYKAVQDEFSIERTITEYEHFFEQLIL
jgi:glycosyltransferase involved in cell wall biosynthesis